MKKILAALLLLSLVLFCAGASANSWGLSGSLYQAVESSGLWKNYSALSNQAGPFAVMKSRYHHALFFADEDRELHVYTTAVYQPEAKRKAPKLSLDDRELTIRYGEDEYYRFWDTDEGYELTEAVIGLFRLIALADEDGLLWHYAAQDAEGIAVFPVKITLASFNIDLFPRSVEEVRRLNALQARFDSRQRILGTGSEEGGAYSPDDPGELLQPKKKGTAAVYSAPYGTAAWRAGKGKAAVGLNGSMYLLSLFTDAGGTPYACIRYDVSERTQRIGYALCGDLGLSVEEDEANAPFAAVEMEASVDTYLTDDPDVSQFRQLSVPAGTRVTCLGLYNDYYAYVSAKVNNGRPADKGSVVWGFVPARDLIPADLEPLAECMAQVAGDWYLESGGSLTEDLLQLRADGTFSEGFGEEDEADAGEYEEEDTDADTEEEEEEELIIPGAHSGTWFVTRYDPSMNLYWDEPPFEITLMYGNGSVRTYGMSMTDTHLSFTCAEEGASYIPWTWDPDAE
ncbi:MAG: hypothetical protein IKQ45_05580 [Clostridia bacterium]|nr:hypothetical protein [Clostridia bacterium]